MRSLLRKKGAIELSMTTVVVIVLAMTMLALGLTLVRTLFQGAIYTAQSLSENTQKEIDKIFSQEDKDLLLVGPPNRQLGICPDSNPYLHYYLNSKEGGSIALTITKSNPTGCTDAQMNRVTTRLSVPPSQTYAPNSVQKSDTILFTVPSDMPVGCGFYLTLNAKWPDGTSASDSMYVQVKSTSLTGCSSD